MMVALSLEDRDEGERAQRIMRQHRLLQPTRGLDPHRRPGYFRVTRPDDLWHMDMTKVWTAAHGWVYLHVIVDCCTREIAAGRSTCAPAPTKRSPVSKVRCRAATSGPAGSC
jgi:transposase InsO family protein